MTTYSKAVRAGIIVAVVGLALTVTGSASALPSTFLFSAHLGWKVDQTTGGNLCTVESKDVCVPGEESTEASGFDFAEGLATDSNGDVYVADKVNHRVQKFAEDGSFILMFGWKVDKTTGANVCTAASHDQCGAGEAGTGLAGQMLGGQSVAVDQVTHNVYVLEVRYNRVEEYTENGAFVVMFGAQVNETARLKGETANENVCPVEAGDICESGIESEKGSKAHAALKTEGSGYGNLIAVNPVNHRLYVGDEARVQEFEASGQWVAEISLSALSTTGKASGIALDSKGNLFVADRQATGVHVYDGAGVLQPCVIDGSSAQVHAVAIDPHDRIGVIDWAVKPHGALIDTEGVECGKELSQFTPTSGAMPSPSSLAFGPSDNAYVADTSGLNQELEIYEAVRFPEVVTVAADAIGATSGKLNGEVNPEELKTDAFFEYGTTAALGLRTPLVFEGEGDAFVPFSFELAGLLPNQTYFFRAAAEAEVKGAVGQAHGAILSFHTSTPAPDIPGAPEAQFVGFQSADLTGEFNTEHAATRYHFEYQECSRCGECTSFGECLEPGKTAEATSVRPGLTAVSQEASGLTPSTTYLFRLVADNAFTFEGNPEGGESFSEVGQFSTDSAPVPSAVTGVPMSVTATTALVTGSVNPDGQPATYTFVLGIDKGIATQYGTVLSAPAGAGVEPVEKRLMLTGLQPGTEYAYKIAVHSGFGTSEGEVETFRTAGLPDAIPVDPELRQLETPKNIKFPKPEKKVTPAEKLARALAACTKKPRSKRAACRRHVRKTYAAKKGRAGRTGHRSKGQGGRKG